METRELLRTLLERRKLTVTALARLLQTSGRTPSNIQPNLSRWLRDSGMSPAASTMQPVADYFGVPMQAFYDRRAAMREIAKLKPNGSGNADFVAMLSGETLIPVVGSAGLSDNCHFVELEFPVGHGDGHVVFATADTNAYAVRCCGDSMSPRIRNGEFVIVEPNVPVQPGDEVLVKASDGRVMVKTYLYTRDDLVHLVSVNAAHPPISIPVADVEAMHYVAGTAKKARWKAP